MRVGNRRKFFCKATYFIMRDIFWGPQFVLVSNTDILNRAVELPDEV